MMCDKCSEAGSALGQESAQHGVERLEQLDICMLRCAAVTAAVADAMAYAPADKNTYLPALHLVEAQLMDGGRQTQEVLKNMLQK